MISSVAGNEFVLPAGRYEIDGDIPAFLSSQHKTRLVDAVTGETLIIGTTGFTNGGTAAMTHSFIRGTITLSDAKTVRVEHRCGQSHTLGFGYASGFGEPEIYSQVKVTKID